MIHISRMAGSI